MSQYGRLGAGTSLRSPLARQCALMAANRNPNLSFQRPKGLTVPSTVWTLLRIPSVASAKYLISRAVLDSDVTDIARTFRCSASSPNSEAMSPGSASMRSPSAVCTALPWRSGPMGRSGTRKRMHPSCIANSTLRIISGWMPFGPRTESTASLSKSRHSGSSEGSKRNMPGMPDDSASSSDAYAGKPVFAHASDSLLSLQAVPS